MGDPSLTGDLDATEGARMPTEHMSLNVQGGLCLPPQLKTRVQQGQQVHGNGLPDPFSTASICGNLVAAVPEHPEELSPQSALQKKSPCGVNGHGDTGVDGSSSVNGPNEQLHLGSNPLAHSAAPPTQSASEERTEGSGLKSLESKHFQTEVKEKELDEAQQTNQNSWPGGEVVQNVDGPPGRIRSILSQEELLEGAQENLDAPSNALAGYDTHGRVVEKKEDGQSTTPISPGARILRSKTVMVPVLNTSRVPGDTPIRRETAFVQWNHYNHASPAVDSSRGRERMDSLAGCQAARRTQSDAGGLYSGGVNVQRTSREALGVMAKSLHASSAAWRRGTSVFRRSPQRLREHLITRNTPEVSIPRDLAPPSSYSCSQEGMLEISADAEHVRVQVGQEQQAAPNRRPEKDTTFTTHNITNSLGDMEVTFPILLANKRRMTIERQGNRLDRSGSREQGHTAKQGCIRIPEGSSVSAKTFKRLLSSGHQTKRTAQEAYKKSHSEVQSFSSQLQKRLSRRSARSRVKPNYGGRELAMRHRKQKISPKALCKQRKYNKAATVKQTATNDRGLEDSSSSMSAVGGSNTASPTRKPALYWEKTDHQPAVAATYDRAGEHTERVQELENTSTTFPPHRSSLRSSITSECLAEETLREHCSASKECDTCCKEAVTPKVMPCEGHRMEVSLSLCNPQMLDQRAASCIDLGSYGVTHLQWSGPPVSSPQRSRSLSWDAGCSEDAQTALLPIRQRRQVKLTPYARATYSQVPDMPLTEKNKCTKERMGTCKRLSVGEPARSSEPQHLLGYLEPQDAACIIECIDSTVSAERATPFRVDVEKPQQEPAEPQAFQGNFRNEARSKPEGLMDAISVASSQSPYSHCRQSPTPNNPSQLLLDSQPRENAVAAAQPPGEPGAESGVMPCGVPVGISMVIGGNFAQMGSREEALNVSNGVHAVRHFLGQHIVKHPQAILFTEGGEQMAHSTIGHGSEQPATELAGLSKSSIWVAPHSVLISRLGGFGAYSGGEAVKLGDACETPHDRIIHFGSLQFNEEVAKSQCCARQVDKPVNVGHLSGKASKCAEGDSFVQRPADSQKEPSGLPSAVHPSPGFSAPLHARGQRQAHVQKDNYCPPTVDSELHAFCYGRRQHTPGTRCIPGQAEVRVPGALRRAAMHCLHPIGGACQCSGVMCCRSGIWHEHTFCRTPILCSNRMRDSVLLMHHRGTLFRRFYLSRTLYLKEEALKRRIHSRRKHVELLNKQLTIQRQQLERTLELQQTQFQQRLNHDIFPSNRLKNDRIFRRSVYKSTLGRRKATAICCQERPAALVEAAAAATAAALAVVGGCEQRAHKLLSDSQSPALSVGDSAQVTAGISGKEGVPGATTERPPGLQQQLLTAKLSEEARQEKRPILHTSPKSEELAQPLQGEVFFQSQESNRVAAKEPQRCIASSEEPDNSLGRPPQYSIREGENDWQLQLTLPRISHLDPNEIHDDLGGPMLPRGRSERTCPKLAIGLELSFPSPGRNMSAREAVDGERSYSQIEVTFAPSLPNDSSIPIHKLQTKSSASCNWEGASRGRRNEPSDFPAGVAAFRKRNSMPMTRALNASRRSLSRGNRASHAYSHSSSTAIRDSSSGQRGNIPAKASSLKAGDISLVEGLQGTPGRYRCNAIPMAYQRDPSISIFSQLFEDSFRRQRNLFLLRMQKNLGSISIIRPQRTREGAALQYRRALGARALTRHAATQRSGETAEVASSKQAATHKPDWMHGFHEALKERKTGVEISVKRTNGNTDNNAISGRALLVEDAAENKLCLCPGSLSQIATKAIPHPESSNCMHAVAPSARLLPLPPRRPNFGSFVAAVEADSIC
ncbi:hypothetical protein, conserved [Eimeria praecox]|uniref:Uncharacterized protein n=1 Tax=Eimeria praecox TaxID=51316 RepID=U6GQQ8_9EIME|nr:hypothetical protein, conserved [Eimeria praecox]